ncbi:MAG TPA: hypothetical protein VN728_07905 [Stellaceae bacterium]|jgi:hypothetical protein|nr:hypothetical protein [Stellaceae bacterium]
MTALQVYGRTRRGARLGYFLHLHLRKAAELFGATAELLGIVGGI